MNQTFSITRFGRLLRRYFTDNRGQLAANIGLLVGGLLVSSALAYQGSPGAVSDQRQLLFFLLGWSCWYVFTVQQTAVLNQKERAINYLMQPVSQVEKILLIWLISGVGFVFVYICVFSLFDAVWVSYVNNRDWSPEQLDMMRRQGSLYELKSIFGDKRMGDTPKQLWVLTALLHSFTMALSLLVRRYTLPLIVVIAFSLLIFSYFSNIFLLHALTGSEKIGSPSPFMDANATSPTDQYLHRKVNLPQPLGGQLRYVVGIIAVILLYITAYFRLKEREV